ncbi:MAG: type II secretion system F family protein [Candidatus Thermoplasmatota archaeon]|nr:type II secretion system F family protein [Candidatus Thermoplasmatota archaeon]
MRRENLIAAVSIAGAFVVAILFTAISARFERTSDVLYFTLPFAVSLILIPAGTIRHFRLSQIRSARRNLPEFLRDLSEYTLYGVPLSEAVRMVSTNDYGSLNPEIRKLARSIKSGIPVEEALETFGNEIGVKDIQRIGVILRKAGESGSNTADVISMISHFSSQLELLNEEREAVMKNYSLILIISYAVFFIVIMIIDVRFFEAIRLSSTGSLAFHSSGASILERIFDIGIYVEAVGIGVTIGIVKDRNPISGTLEMGFMILISSIIIALVGAI